MKNKERERQPRNRNTKSSGKKTPLTFYRSTDPRTDSTSPFARKELSPNVSRLRNFFASFFDAVIVVALILLLIYSLVIRPNAKVKLNSEVFHSSKTYQQATDSILKGIKNSNKITFSEQDVVEQLQTQFPEIASASIELPIIAQTPVVHLNIAKPSFVLSSKGQSYIVDSDGVAVAESNGFSGAQKLIRVEDQTGFSDEVGKQVMSAGSVKFINDLVKQCQHANVAISSLSLPNLAQELDLRTSDKPYYVKFYLGGDVLQQTGQFLATRHQLDANNTQPAQYLDVRVQGKIFYK
jgi:cell division septal protein FtsQ